MSKPDYDEHYSHPNNTCVSIVRDAAKTLFELLASTQASVIPHPFTADAKPYTLAVC